MYINGNWLVVAQLINWKVEALAPLLVWISPNHGFSSWPTIPSKVTVSALLNCIIGTFKVSGHRKSGGGKKIVPELRCAGILAAFRTAVAVSTLLPLMRTVIAPLWVPRLMAANAAPRFW